MDDIKGNFLSVYYFYDLFIQNYAVFKNVKMLCGQNNIDYSMVDLRMLCIDLIEGSEITSTYNK